MPFQILHDWLLGGRRRKDDRRKRASGSKQRNKLRTTCLSIDPLESRKLLSATSPTVGPPAVVAPTVSATPAALTGATIVGRYVFYNNSRFDGDNPAPNALDDSAIAIDKKALLPGQPASFANYTSYSNGINGIMVDIAGLTGVPTASDFVFQVGNSNDPSTWTLAPAPASITVRQGAGVGGSARVTITWSDDAIKNEWLQVDVRSTSDTGLTRPDIFYFGNEVGESGNSSQNAFVNSTDSLAARNNPRDLTNPAPIWNNFDYNRDGLVDAADELIATQNTGGTSLKLITPDPTFSWTAVVGENVFYNNSVYNGNNSAATSSDDLAIAPDKTALLPGQAATFANYTSFSGGLNGLMIDVEGLDATPSLSDFTFLVGDNSNTSTWTQAPAPTSITVRIGAGVNGSTRVTLIWSDRAIQDQWLQVTVNAMPDSKLIAPMTFTFGNEIGETGNSTTDGLVNSTDLARVQAAIGTTPVTITSPFDINRDGTINTTDVNLVQNTISHGRPLVLFTMPVPTSNALPSDTTGETAFTDFVSAAVVGREIFYNNSAFDGNNAAANASDDQAVATDKSALLPGGTATFANYTSYSRGINGIMVNIAGLPATPTAADFTFLVGNNGSTSTWTAAPAPASITVRQGAGVGGSARVTITWADNAIENEWLQVTVLADPRTGITQPDTFYFGNEIGVSGQSTGTAPTAMDRLATRNSTFAIGSLAPITATADYNRDGLVNTADEWIAVAAMNAHSAPLQLISPPAVAQSATPQRPSTDLFSPGDAGYSFSFNPAIITTTDGTVVEFAEGRTSVLDTASYAIIERRSTDGGVTWSPITAAVSIAPNTTDWVGNAAPVVDAKTGTLFLVYNEDNNLVLVTSSTDDGVTWSTPVDITDAVKVTPDGNPNPTAFPSTPWGWYAMGPGHGIQMENGPHAGRLVIAADHRLTSNINSPSWANIIYSDDDGATWHLGGGLDETNPANNNANESTVVEDPSGALYMSSRMLATQQCRGYSWSYDGGQTWTTLQFAQQLTSFDVEGSLLRIDANTVIFSGPNAVDDTRHSMTIWISTDDMQTWHQAATLFYGYAGYSDMTLVGPDTVLLTYNRGFQNTTNLTDDARQYIGLARFNLRFLESAAAPQFTWNFNDAAPGQAANTLGPSIMDSSKYDERAQAQAASLSQAPVYVAGPNGNTALSLNTNNDVLLSPANTYGLQFSQTDSFTIEISMQTTSTTGVIIGTEPSDPNWTLLLSAGKPVFTMHDTQGNLFTLAGTTSINDGNWHTIAIVRNASTHLVQLFVDGVLSTPAQTDTTKSTITSTDAMTLNGFNNGSGRITMNVDTVRITRGALAQNQLLPTNYVEPPRYPSPTYPANAPNMIPNLQLWMPGFDYSRDFSDMNFSVPMPLDPATGLAVESMIDASPNQYRVTNTAAGHSILYENDPTIGPVWLQAPPNLSSARSWTVANSNGTQANNFDFIQNTGVFTISAFINVGASLGASTMTLFDTDEAALALPGFDLALNSDGTLRLQVTGTNSLTRFNGTASTTPITPGTWYQVAVVANGPNNPVAFYVTPVSASTVSAATSTTNMTGANGTYSTDANHNLRIGARANTDQMPFNGEMVDQAVYNRALSAAEIQELFNYTKSQ